MQKILISACLVGEIVRYDGKRVPLNSIILERWQEEDRLISICPEVAGGLTVPRQPAEIQGEDGTAIIGGSGSVINADGFELTDDFLKGAKIALKTALEHRIQLAILKNLSPSCGNNKIYDGTFTRHLKKGLGVTAALLKANHIRVFHEGEITAAATYLTHLERTLPPHPSKH